MSVVTGMEACGGGGVWGLSDSGAQGAAQGFGI